MPDLQEGEEAVVKGSFEVVTVIRQEGAIVLVERAGGQTTYNRDQLEPLAQFCPLP